MVSPERIEETIRLHERVLDCQVSAEVHPRFGEVPVARVSGNEVSADELIRWCSERLPVEERPVSFSIAQSPLVDLKAQHLLSHFETVTAT